MPRAKLKRWIAGAIVALAMIALGVFAWFSPSFSLPEPSGPNRVGVIAFELTDNSRRGLLGTSRTQPRKLPVRAWYPAADDARGPTRPYLEAYQALSLGRTFGEGRYFFAYLSRIGTHSIIDAPLKQNSEAYPLVIFNHGFWSYPEQNTAMMELLASHGYVVVSIGHPGDGVETRFADGTEVEPFYDPEAPPERDAQLQAGIAAFMGPKDDEARFTGLRRFESASFAHRIGDSARIWRDDSLFVLRELQQRRVQGRAAELAERLDFARLAVGGMSFGGSTAPSVCQSVPACRAAVNLDGESFDFSMYNADLRAPVLLILTGQKFNSSQLEDSRVNPVDYAYERWAHAGERNDVIRMRVPTLRHLGLTDLLLSAPRPSKAHLYGTIDGQRGVALTNEATLQFLDTYVRGRDEGFPKAFYAKYPEAQPHDASHVKSWWLARNEASGCMEDQARAAQPVNDTKNMRLGSWISKRSACEAQ